MIKFHPYTYVLTKVFWGHFSHPTLKTTTCNKSVEKITIVCNKTWVLKNHITCCCCNHIAVYESKRRHLYSSQATLINLLTFIQLAHDMVVWANNNVEKFVLFACREREKASLVVTHTYKTLEIITAIKMKFFLKSISSLNYNKIS